MRRYRKIGTQLNNDYRNDLNANFETIENEINSIKGINDDDRAYMLAELQRIEKESKYRDDALAKTSLEALLASLENAKNSALDAAVRADLIAEGAKQNSETTKLQGIKAEEQGNYAELKGNYANEKAEAAQLSANKAENEASNLGSLKTNMMDLIQSVGTDETARNNAEFDRSTNEAQRNLNEENRILKENERIAAETTRQTQETKRQTDSQTAVTNANNAATHATNQGDYAKTQGDTAKLEAQNLSTLKTDVTNAANNANSKATLAQQKVDSLSTLETNINTAITNAQTATSGANTAATHATTQGDYAKAQGDYAKQMATDIANKAGVTSVNGKSGAVTLTFTDLQAASADHTHTELHTHTNKTTLDKFGEAADGSPTFNGLPVGSVATVNGQTGAVVLDFETPQGAKSKADTAEANANAYTDLQIKNVKGFSGNYNDLINKPIIPSKTSELTNDAGFITDAPVKSVNGKVGMITLTASELGAETPEGAQAKANLAEQNAKTYTDNQIANIQPGGGGGGNEIEVGTVQPTTAKIWFKLV